MSKQQTWPDGVSMIDTEQAQLETVLETVRNNPDVRRPDGRKSPMMLAGQAALRLRAENQQIMATLNRAVAATQVAESLLRRLESSLWVRLGRWLRVCP